MTGATLLRSVDRAAWVAAFAVRLRRAGIAVGLSSADRLAVALSHCAPTDQRTLYWVCRTCLIHDRRHFDAFDQVFSAVFSGDSMPPGEQLVGRSHAVVTSTGTIVKPAASLEAVDSVTGRVSAAIRPEVVDELDINGDDAEPIGLPELLPSRIAELADSPFDQLSVDDLDLLGRWLNEVTNGFETRRSRRYRPAHHSESIDMRRTLLAARATGGEPIRLARRRVRQRPRKVVMLADVSASMESFSRIYLHLMRSLVMHGDAEVFVFSTSLRRVTAQLRDGDPAAAVDRLSAEVIDRFGGTRIGASIGELVSSPIWSNTVRGALVVIASDGWDADPPDLLGQRMQRLRRMAHRVIWVNPRAAADEFEPLVGGMAAALPFADELLSGHTLNAMHAVIASLGRGRVRGISTPSIGQP